MKVTILTTMSIVLTLVIFQMTLVSNGGLVEGGARKKLKKWKKKAKKKYKKARDSLPAKKITEVAKTVAKKTNNAVLTPALNEATQLGKGVALAATSVAADVAKGYEDLGNKVAKFGMEAWDALEEGFDDLLAMFPSCLFQPGTYTDMDNLMTCFVGNEYIELKEQAEDMKNSIAEAFDAAGKTISREMEDVMNEQSKAIFGAFSDFGSALESSISSKKTPKGQVDVLKRIDKAFSDLGFNFPINIQKLTMNHTPDIDFNALNKPLQKVMKEILKTFVKLGNAMKKAAQKWVNKMKARRRRQLRQNGRRLESEPDVCFDLTLQMTLGTECLIPFWSPAVVFSFCFSEEGDYLSMVLDLGQFTEEEESDVSFQLDASFGKSFGSIDFDSDYNSLGGTDFVVTHGLALGFGVSVGWGQGYGISVDGGFGGGLSGGSFGGGFGASLSIFGLAKSDLSRAPLSVGASVSSVNMQLTVPMSAFKKNGGKRGDGVEALSTAASDDDGLSSSQLLAMSNPIPDNMNVVVMLKDRHDNKCVTSAISKDWSSGSRSDCDQDNDSHFWSLNDQQLQNLGDSDRCLTKDSNSNYVRWKSCDYDEENGTNLQKWTFLSNGRIKHNGSGKCLEYQKRLLDCGASTVFKTFWVTGNQLLTTRAGEGELYCLSKHDSYKNNAGNQGHRHRPVLLPCTGFKGQEFAFDSSSNLMSGDTGGNGNLLTWKSANGLYYRPDSESHDPVLFHGDGQLKVGDNGCLARKAGAVNGYLALKSCERIDPGTTLIHDTTWMKLANGARQSQKHCLSMVYKNKIGNLNGCDDNYDSRHWRLNGGKLESKNGRCLIIKNGGLYGQTCGHSDVTKFTWAYDPDAFWLYYLRSDGKKMCIRANDDTSSRSLSFEACKTDPKFQWGNKDKIFSSGIRSQLFFTAVPFKMHVMSQADNKCIRRKGISASAGGYSSGTTYVPKVETCSDGNQFKWVYVKETRQLKVDGKCLQMSSKSYLVFKSCDSSKTTQKFVYDPVTRLLTGTYDGHRKCMGLEGSYLRHRRCVKDIHLTPPDSYMLGPNWMPIAFDTVSEPSRFNILMKSGYSGRRFRKRGDRLGADRSSGDNNADFLFYLTTDGQLRWKDYVLAGNPDVDGAKLKFIQEKDLFDQTWKPYHQWAYNTQTLQLESMTDPTLCLRMYSESYSTLYSCDSLVSRGHEINF